LRLFLGIWPSEAATRALTAAQAELRRRLPRGLLRFTAPDQIHLTLRFLGEIPEPEIASFVPALEEASASESPFPLALAPLGAFPAPERARVVWAGAGGGVERLHRLQARIEAVVAAFTHPEDKPFHPHFTLARVREPAGAERREIAAALAGIRVGRIEPWLVDEFRLVRSELRPEGAHYSVVRRIPLLTTR